MHSCIHASSLYRQPRRSSKHAKGIKKNCIFNSFPHTPTATRLRTRTHQCRRRWTSPSRHPTTPGVRRRRALHTAFQPTPPTSRDRPTATRSSTRSRASPSPPPSPSSVNSRARRRRRRSLPRTSFESCGCAARVGVVGRWWRRARAPGSSRERRADWTSWNEEYRWVDGLDRGR